MKKINLKKCSGLISALVLMSGAGAVVAADALNNASPIKVAVVNVQQVLQQSPRVAELSKKLESQFKARQEKIALEQKTLQDQLDKLKKESLTMNQKDKDATQKKISADRAELVKQVMSYQQDLNKEQGKVMQTIMGDLNGVVSNIAKKQSYALVLDSQAVIYSNGGNNDITTDVAKEFNGKS